MSYQMYISRGFQCDEDEDFTPIELSTWEEFIASSAAYETKEFLEAKNPNTGEILKMKLFNAAYNIEHDFILEYREGVISAKGVTELIPYYKAVAKALDAQVYGEEGELY